MAPANGRRPHPLCLPWLQGGSEINVHPPRSRDKGREDGACTGRAPGRAGRLQAATQRLRFPHPLGRTPPFPTLVLLHALVGLQEQG